MMMTVLKRKMTSPISVRSRSKRNRLMTGLVGVVFGIVGVETHLMTMMIQLRRMNTFQKTDKPPGG